MAEAKKLKVTLVKSSIRNTANIKANLVALGLRRMHQTVVLPDSPQIRGMLFKVQHCITVEEVSE